MESVDGRLYLRVTEAREASPAQPGFARDAGSVTAQVFRHVVAPPPVWEKERLLILTQDAFVALLISGETPN